MYRGAPFACQTEKRPCQSFFSRSCGWRETPPIEALGGTQANHLQTTATAMAEPHERPSRGTDPGNSNSDEPSAMGRQQGASFSYILPVCRYLHLSLVAASAIRTAVIGLLEVEARHSP